MVGPRIEKKMVHMLMLCRNRFRIKEISILIRWQHEEKNGRENPVIMKTIQTK